MKIIQTDEGLENIDIRCPNCNSTEIKYNQKSGKLRCSFCKTTFEKKEIKGIEKNIKKLKEKKIGSGARNIQKENDIITLKCTGCGAEVIIDTKEASHARCHWCHSILSINKRLENGTIPDAILPFSVEKEEAMEEMKNFIKQRSFYAHPKFKEDFKEENVVGVYFPYMLVDANMKCEFLGEGEHTTKTHLISVNNKQTYDVDVYQVGRKFDATIEGFTIESKAERISKKSEDKTNNIINAIMPFDTENKVAFESNYLIGYTSENRNLDISNMKGKVKEEIKDIIRLSLNNELEFYDRGIKWEQEEVKEKGTQWITAYLPVWLYSYHEKGKLEDITHYIAVNGRTKEIMGSIPVNTKKLLLMTILLELPLLWIAYLLGVLMNDSTTQAVVILVSLIPGLYFYTYMYEKCRNYDARHTYEKETKVDLKIIEKEDIKIDHLKRISSGKMIGANNKEIKGETTEIEKE